MLLTALCILEGSPEERLAHTAEAELQECLKKYLEVMLYRSNLGDASHKSGVVVEDMLGQAL